MSKLDVGIDVVDVGAKVGAKVEVRCQCRRSESEFDVDVGAKVGC